MFLKWCKSNNVDPFDKFMDELANIDFDPDVLEAEGPEDGSESELQEPDQQGSDSD